MLQVDQVISSVTDTSGYYARGRNWRKLGVLQRRALVAAVLASPLSELYVPNTVPPLLECVLRNSVSQFREDLILLPELLMVAGGRPGTFVELGAFDGINASNTLVLERCFNWTGLLIEANPVNFEALQTRSGRRSTMIHSAVCTPAGVVQMTVNGGAKASQFGQWRKETVEVPCQPLTRIMEAAGLPKAHFFSLDVEGAEDKVLKASNPAAFSLILVEALGNDVAKDERVEGLITRAGLQRATNLTIFWSRVYRGVSTAVATVMGKLSTVPHIPIVPHLAAPKSCNIFELDVTWATQMRLHPAHVPCNWEDHQFASELWMDRGVRDSSWTVPEPGLADVIYLSQHSLSLWCTRSRAVAVDHLSSPEPSTRLKGRACPDNEQVNSSYIERAFTGLSRAAARTNGTLLLTSNPYYKQLMWKRLLQHPIMQNAINRSTPVILMLTNNECTPPWTQHADLPPNIILQMVQDRKPRAFDHVVPLALSSPPWLVGATGSAAPPVPVWSARKLLFFGGHIPKLFISRTRYRLWQQLRLMKAQTTVLHRCHSCIDARE